MMTLISVIFYMLLIGAVLTLIFYIPFLALAGVHYGIGALIFTKVGRFIFGILLDIALVIGVMYLLNIIL